MLRLNPLSSIPPYAQLKEQIITARDCGDLPSNYRLPPVRHLARELGVAPGTVARAYKELERIGIVETRGRHGTYILPLREEPSPHLSPEEAATLFTQTARRAGLTVDQALTLAISVIKEKLG